MPVPIAAPISIRSTMSDLHTPVLEWYDEHARDLPWRRTDASAWSVMVSEFMLQQTPVARVLPVHEAWLEQWPTPAALGAAETGEAVRAWGRLGYPRRALRLHAAATAIVADHGGEVPAEYADLLALPGVGDYTAAAIASFAFGQRHVVLDTNIRRLIARTIDGAEHPGPSYAGWPAARQAHRSAIGQRGQDGFVAVHTSAPSSITATAHVAAVGSSSGSSPVARSRSARVTAVAGNSTPVTARARTRRTLVSSTTWRRPYANDAIAAAV